MVNSSSHTVIVVCGPTAVGKTAVAIELARALGTEILNADSRQVYDRLNIGVAKPSAAELAAVKHHLVGSQSIETLYGAGDFEDDALQLVNDLFKQHQTLVMCGGTGMYIKAFCEGLDELPGANEIYRQYLHDTFKQQGITFLQEELRKTDPVALEKIDPENPQRLMRALEVIKVSGKKYSELLTGKKNKRPFNIIKTGLNMDRQQLYQRINHRVDQMIQEGLMEEVMELYPLKHLNALKTVGYTELFAAMDGECTREEAVSKIKQHTRNYAKRQLTWFRADHEINWFETTGNTFAKAQIDQIISFVRSKI